MDDIKQRRRIPIAIKADFTASIDEKDHITEIDENPQAPITATTPIYTAPVIAKKKRRFPSWKNFSKKQKILTIVGSVVLVIVIISLFFVFQSHPKVAKNTITKVVATKTIPKKVPVIVSPLSGLPVTLAQSQLPVTAVMIENSDQARPQSGLSQAGVIFEALAEGGITRFVALYQENEPSSIGPIRSARPYFIDWMLPFDAAYAHVGGSPQALTQITTDSVRDINQFYYGSSFIRIASREAPHNVYTSIAALQAVEKTNGWTTSTFQSFPRKADAPSAAPTATLVNFNISGTDYAITYTYDPAKDAYLRDEGGQAMIDANTNQQLEPKVVVGLVVPLSRGALDASGAYYSVYGDIGSGEALVFQDGTVTVGTWTKASPQSQIVLKDSAGNPISFNAGQVWFTALSSSSQITYSD